MPPSVLIFIVEDDEVIRQLLEDALTDGGFAVAAVVTGEEAMATLNARGADFSALVADINLPGKISGWDVAKHSREINDTIPVIYVSGASAYEWGSKGVPQSKIISKPFAVAQVVTAVSQLINEAAQPT